MSQPEMSSSTFASLDADRPLANGHDKVRKMFNTTIDRRGAPCLRGLATLMRVARPASCFITV